jgi:hypothetical protein
MTEPHQLLRALADLENALELMRTCRQRYLDLLREVSENRNEEPPEPAETPQAFAHSKSTTFQRVRTSIIGPSPHSKRFS